MTELNNYIPALLLVAMFGWFMFAFACYELGRERKRSTVDIALAIGRALDVRERARIQRRQRGVK